MLSKRVKDYLPAMFFCMLLFPHYTLAQAGIDRRFLQYSVVDGLSQNSVHCIYRDRSGLVWIGTQDGLNKFDGKTFTSYRHSDIDEQTISDQFVLTIKEDSKGFLWIGTRNGLNKFDKRSGKFTRYYSSAEDKHIFQASYETFYIEEGNMIYGLKVKPFVLDPATKKVKHINSPSSSVGHWIIAAKYKAWYTDTLGKSYYYDDVRTGKYQIIESSPLNPGNGSAPISLFCKNNLLVYCSSSSSSEIIFYNTESQKSLKKFLLPLRISSISYDEKADVLWLSCSDGLYQMNMQGKISKIDNGAAPKYSLPPGTILCSYTDNEGSLWVGTAGSGLAVSNTIYNNYTLLPSPAQGSIVTAVTIADNILFVATRSGLYKKPVTQLAKAAQSFTSVIPQKDISALATDINKNVWAATTNEGLLILNSAGKILQKIDLKIDGQYRTCLHLNYSQADKMYISTINGLYVAAYDAGTRSYRLSASSYPTNGSYVMHTYEEPSGNLWVASNTGVDLFSADAKRLLSYDSQTDSNSFLNRTIITTIEKGKDGSVWIGTIRSGVYRVLNKKFQHYTTRSGLSSDVINNIIIDDRDRAWVSTTSGLNLLNEGGQTFTTLSTAQGVPNTSYSFSSAFKNNGKIYFGTSEGLLIIDANKVQVVPEEVKAFVKDIKVNGQSILFQNNKLQIMPDGKLIIFELGSSPAFSPRNVIYQYRISSQKNNWITLPERSNTISYTGLAYGDLRLEVRAAHAEIKLEAAEVYTLGILSRAPWYKSLPFIILGIFLVLAMAGYLIARYNREKYKRQLQELELAKELQTERNRIGRDLHDNMGAYTSAMIAGLNQIKVQDVQEEKQLENLKDYGANIMGYLRETIWMLNTEDLTITAFTDRIKNYSLRISHSYPSVELEVKEDIQDDRKLAPTQMLNVFRIIQEALNNAYKHAGATNIIITVISKDKLYFEIQDDGKGFNAQEKEDHYGIINMKERAAASSFELQIKSNEDGTSIKLIENTANAS